MDSFLSGPYGIAVDAALFLAALALRFTLGFRTDLWFDEIHSIAIAENSLRDICSPASLQGFGPLYFLFLKGWMQIATSELWLRLPSILASSIMPLLLRRYLARQFAAGTALLAALFCVLAPWNIYNGSQVRMHVFGGIILLGWLLASSQPARAILALAGACTLPTLSLFLGVLWFLPEFRRDRPGLGIAICAAFLIASGGLASGVRYEPAQIQMIPGTVKAIFFGPYLEEEPSLFSIAATGCGMILTLHGAWLIGRRGLTMITLAYIPLHLIMAVSIIMSSFWNRRFVLPSAPFIFALTSLGIMGLPKGIRLLLVPLSLLVIAHFSFRILDLSDNFHWRTDRRPLMREVLSELRQNRSPILLDKSSAAPVFMWYGPDLEAYADSRTISFALPSHRQVIESFLRRRGVHFEPPPENLHPVPISDLYPVRRRQVP